MILGSPEQINCQVVNIRGATESLERYGSRSVSVLINQGFTDQRVWQRSHKALDVTTGFKKGIMIDLARHGMIVSMSAKLLQNVAVPHTLKVFGGRIQEAPVHTPIRVGLGSMRKFIAGPSRNHMLRNGPQFVTLAVEEKVPPAIMGGTPNIPKAWTWIYKRLQGALNLTKGLKFLVA